MSNADFKRNFAKLLDAVGDKAEQMAARVSEDLIGAIVYKTPVDVGGLVANWNLSFGAADLTNTHAPNSDPMERARANLANFKLGDHVFIVNNMPYAKRIEFDGWSKEKAPQGMVRITVLEFSKIVKRNAAKAKNGG